MPEKTHRIRNRTVFSVWENMLVVAVIVFLFVVMSLRLQNSVYTVNKERAKRELANVSRIEENIKLRTGNYTDELDFKLTYPYSGILYSVRLDAEKGFVAYAIEAVNTDAFGDNKPGNQFYSLTASGVLNKGSFPTE